MSPKKQKLDFKFSQTISDVIIGIFHVVYDECVNHKGSKSVLNTSEASNFRFTFRYGALGLWLFGSKDRFPQNWSMVAISRG